MDKRVGIIMHGVTGRMGTHQHLERSILAIRGDGGVVLPDRTRIIPEPILVGRNEDKLARLAQRYGIDAFSTELDVVLGDPEYPVFFDSAMTEHRPEVLERAISAGKDTYCEKPTATTSARAMELYRAAQDAGIVHGVVQDKLWLPGLLKLKYLIDTGFFGEILSVRGEFGYWVFDGFHQATQRPSWNYRKEDGGGIILDMFCHWRYVIDNLFGEVTAVSALGATHVPRRVNERGQEYTCTADDAAYATFELSSGVICQFNSSWATRVRRDDLLTLHVDGTAGSAVAGLRDCRVLSDAQTPKPVWNPDIAQDLSFFDGWQLMPDRDPYDNAFRRQWELYLTARETGEVFPWDLREGAKGVQLAELGLKSWEERRWVDVPPLTD